MIYNNQSTALTKDSNSNFDINELNILGNFVYLTLRVNSNAVSIPSKYTLSTTPLIEIPI